MSVERGAGIGTERGCCCFSWLEGMDGGGFGGKRGQGVGMTGLEYKCAICMLYSVVWG